MEKNDEIELSQSNEIQIQTIRSDTEFKRLMALQDKRESFYQRLINKLKPCAVIFQIALLCLIILFYLLSLQGCHLQFAECMVKFRRGDITTLLYYCYTSSALFVFATVLAVYKRLRPAVYLLTVVSMVYLLQFYDTGADLAYHGSYNKLFFLLMTGLNILLSLVLVLGYRAVRRWPILSTLLVIVACFGIYKLIDWRIKNSCDYYNGGLGGSVKPFGTGNCVLPTPHTCFYKYTDGLFDLSFYYGINCPKDRLDEEITLLKKWANKPNANKLGFPRIEQWDHIPSSTFPNFKFNIFKNMVDMEKDTEKAKDVEVYIDFTGGSYPEVVIDVKRNETLVEERKKVYNKTNSYFKNVLYIYIDSFSRNQFRRKFTKTFKFLEDYYQNNTSEYSSYQFWRYHSLTYYTYANMIPGLYGVFKYDTVNPNNYYLNHTKSAGYITGQAYDGCCRELFDLEDVFKDYLYFTNYDHEFNGFYCDPTYSDPDTPYSSMKGAMAVIRKCMYGKDAGEHQIDYAKQFFDKYEDSPKMFRMGFDDSHEGSGEVIKYMDEPIHDFLVYLRDKGHLKDTLVLFQADHGVSMPGPAYMIQSPEYYYEIFLPMLFVLIPKNNEHFDELNTNLAFNEDKFITPFDIHASLINLFEKNSTKTIIGESIFSNKIDDSHRNCGQYGIENGECLCYYNNLI
jgi:hypothetical protein